MKRYKALSVVFVLLAVLLSDLMCAAVAYSYSNLYWGGQYAGYSAPPDTAFLLAIPFACGIIACLIASLAFRRKAKKTTKTEK